MGRKIGSAALVADGVHARTDGFTSLVVLRGAVRDVFGRLMDGVDPALAEAVETVLLAMPGVKGIESLRLRWIGHRLHAEVGLTVDAELDQIASHELGHDAQHWLMHEVPKLTDATVHISPTSDDATNYHASLAHHPHQ